MSEKTKFRGRLRERELAQTSMRLEIEGLVDSIRNILDPFAPIEDLKTDIAAEQAVRLSELTKEYALLKAKIHALEREIDG
jgi:hypothetical protein